MHLVDGSICNSMTTGIGNLMMFHIALLLRCSRRLATGMLTAARLSFHAMWTNDNDGPSGLPCLANPKKQCDAAQ